jgi:ATP-dependent helicase HrpA
LPEWIESVGSHLIKKSYSEPKWDKHAGRVIAMEKGTMQGLEIYAKRRVHFGEVNPKEAREIFVHHALVHGEIEKPPPQLRANIELETKVSSSKSAVAAVTCCVIMTSAFATTTRASLRRS